VADLRLSPAFWVVQGICGFLVLLLVLVIRAIQHSEACSLKNCRSLYDKGNRELAVERLLDPLCLPAPGALVEMPEVASGLVDSCFERVRLLEMFTEEYGDLWMHILRDLKLSVQTYGEAVRQIRTYLPVDPSQDRHLVEAYYLFEFSLGALRRINRYEHRNRATAEQSHAHEN